MSKLRPPARCCFSMAYDPADHEVVMFGGARADGNRSNAFGDTWTYASGLWTNLTPSLSVSPPAREHAAMVFDAADGYLLMFGGDSCSSSAPYSCNDSWAFVGGAWSPIPAVSAPGPRSAAAITYDSSDGYVVLYGGVTDTSANSSPLSETWTYRGGIWTNRTGQLSVNPPPSVGAGFAYDARDGYALLDGGNLSGQSWTYSAGAWKRLFPVVGPPPRIAPQLTYDGANGTVLMFGGISNQHRLFRDTWRF
ncbi:MAG: hypothetical protein L3J96_00935, partial [Thermoplasmata archaeon]|nr:hypothetical protein [Thermoplasmata archaeon]